MIKTYKARVQNNNISYMLEGKHGNQMRYNFVNGNIITNKYPTITLRNRYAQELLESSLLFANNTVVLEHTDEEYPGEIAALEQEKKEAEAAAEKASTEAKEPTVDVDPKNLIEEDSVRTDADLIAFVNKVDQRTEKNAFTTAARAKKWADEHYYKFPNYNPE